MMLSLWQEMRDTALFLASVCLGPLFPYIGGAAATSFMPAAPAQLVCGLKVVALCMQYSQAATLPSKLNNTEHLTQNNGMVARKVSVRQCLGPCCCCHIPFG